MKYIFAKNLSVRLTSQVVLIRLVEQAGLINEYQLIYENVRHEHTANEQTARLKKWCPLDDVRLNHIDCKHLLNSVYFLRELPRLTRMCSDEIYHVPLADFNERLLIGDVAVFARREMSDRDPDLYVQVDDQQVPQMNGHDGLKNTQRKIVPLKQTSIDYELFSDLPMALQATIEVSEATEH